MTEIVYRAMAEALPDRVMASSGGTPATMIVLYGRRKDGKAFHSVKIRGGGMGASAKQDGPQDYIFPANGANTPVEIIESDTPILIKKRELLADSGGPGLTRGGLGRRSVLKIPDDAYAPLSPVNLGIQAGRYRYPPQGIFGGKEGSRARFLVNGEDGDPYTLTRLEPGDQVIMDLSGGGGYGNPLERSPEMVLKDVIEGYVSIENAREDYGVVINPEAMEIDEESTRILRERRR
jgi:N-methylhydantoinase B